MKQMLLSALLGAALMIGFTGCTPSEAPAAEGENPTTSTSVANDSGASTTASTAEMANCDKCQIAVDKATLVSVDGKMLCTHCAPEGTTTAAGGEEVAMAKCADCGKEMAKTELIAHGDAFVCKACDAAHGH
ncbi:MAG: hypothetical protein KF812_03405 [Fimbriimonadaceae bacterium]|nr:hypothetical protein [Fimbriimonadaceae bacterium]